MPNNWLRYTIWHKSRWQGSWEYWKISGFGQGAKESVEYESDNDSISSWSSGYSC